MADYWEAYVEIDVAKLRNAIAIADAGREEEVRFFGEVDASGSNMRHLVQRIAAKFNRAHFCREAGPTRGTGFVGSSNRLAPSARSWRRR